MQHVAEHFRDGAKRKEPAFAPIEDRHPLRPRNFNDREAADASHPAFMEWSF